MLKHSGSSNVKISFGAKSPKKSPSSITPVRASVDLPETMVVAPTGPAVVGVVHSDVAKLHRHNQNSSTTTLAINPPVPK